MIDTEKIVREMVDQRRGEYVDFLGELVRRSRGGEEATQARVAERLRELGCDVEVVGYAPAEVQVRHEFASAGAIDTAERTCVVGRYAGAGGGRSVMFFAHPDGEEVAGTERWQHDPFAGVVEEGRVYGWAVADDLLGVATMVSALDALLAAGLAPRGDVILASTPSKRNARGVAFVLDRGYTADGAIYLHPAESGQGLGEIKAFASGLLRFRITVPGQPPDTREPGHTAFYHLAVDPIARAMVIYAALQALAEKRAGETFHPLLHAAIGRSTNLHVSYVHSGDEARLSRVGSECILGGSVTFPPGEDMSHVQAQIMAAVDATADGDPWLQEHRPQVEWVVGINGAEVPTDHPLYETVSRSVREVTGSEPRVNPLHSASDIRNPILQRGIPTVGLGSLAGDLSQTGGHDEWVDVEDYVRAIKVIATTILRWCGM